MSNILLDTNILLYAIDEESKYFNSVHELLNDDSMKFFITSKNISEFLSVITRIPSTGISIKEALIVADKFKTVFTVLYPTEKSYTIFLDCREKK
ncbi:MAG: PIN domain-containing protein [Ignavibacteria bacterium]